MVIFDVETWISCTLLMNYDLRVNVSEVNYTLPSLALSAFRMSRTCQAAGVCTKDLPNLCVYPVLLSPIHYYPLVATRIRLSFAVICCTYMVYTHLCYVFATTFSLP